VIRVIPAAERYHFQSDWLSTYWHFSFDNYYDPDNVSFGSLRVFNDDTIAPGGGFPEHAHREMEILTYVLEGQLEHRDSLGNRGVIGAGEVQRMSAGTGIRHSEFNASKTEPVHLLQFWIHPCGARPETLVGAEAIHTRAAPLAPAGRSLRPAARGGVADSSGRHRLHLCRCSGS